MKLFIALLAQFNVLDELFGSVGYTLTRAGALALNSKVWLRIFIPREDMLVSLAESLIAAGLLLAVWLLLRGAVGIARKIANAVLAREVSARACRS